MSLIDHPSFVHHQSRVAIRGFYGTLSHPAFSMRVLTEKLMGQALTRKLWHRIRRFDLRPFDPDDLEGRPSRAISVDYDVFFEDRFNRQRNWESIVSKEESAARAATTKEFEARRDELKAKKESDRTDDEKAELLDVLAQIESLALNNPGYLEYVPDPFGDGVSGLYHSLSAPNVPTHRRSKFKIASDTPWSLRLYFHKPHEEQADWEATVQIHRFRLTFTATRVEFVALNPKFTASQIAVREDRLKLLLDKARITQTDEEFKAAKKRDINQIKSTAKAAGRSGEKLNSSEKVAIKAIEKQIDDRWAEKKNNTGAEDNEIRDLQKELYTDRDSVNFGQNFETFFNTPLVLTFLPQRRGYLTIQLEGAQAWSYEVKEITASKKPGTLWPDSKLEIKTRGGSYKWNVGFPKARPGELVIGPLDPGFDMGGLNYTVSGQWDRSDQNDASGASIVWSVNGAPDELKDGSAGRFLYVARAQLAPGPLPSFVDERILSGQTLPFLYDATVFIPAGERNGDEELAWDSDDHFGTDGAPLVKDIKPTWDNRGMLSCSVTIRDIDGEANLSHLNLEGRMCDLWIDATSDDDAPFLARGILRQPEVREGEISFTVNDQLSLLDEAMTARPIGDGMDLGAHIGDVLACRGALESELRGLSTQTGRRLSVAATGDNPANQPAENAPYGRYIDELLETQGLTGGGVWKLRWMSDEVGGFFQLETPPLEVAFVDEGSGLLVEANFTRNTDFSNRLFIRDVDDLPDDDSELWNVFPVEGARDPKTKQPIKETYTVWESIGKEGDLRHIGREKPDSPIKVESLVDKDGCIRAAIARSKLRCRGVKFRKIKIAFLRDVRPGLQIRVQGQKVELVRALGASMADDEMTWLCLRLE